MRQKSHGSTRNYKFGQKNHWRRTLWNEVLRRTDGREKIELILYLAGPQDLDRAVAVSKGVPERNLIAIDHNLANVLQVRSGSNYAIQADAFDVIRSWPKDVPVCALVLDFCSGLMNEQRLGALSNLPLLHESLNDAILAVNLQRGRDAVANLLTTESKRALAYLHSINHPIARGIDVTHRGFAFAFWHSIMGCRNTKELETTCKEAGVNLDVMQPKFFSYRSGVLVFDSVVLSPLFKKLGLSETEVGLLAQILKSQYPKDRTTVRKIAATLATRTRQAAV